MELPDFTVEHLKRLPLRAIVAFAARCARRVEPLAQLPEGTRSGRAAGPPSRPPSGWPRTSRGGPDGPPDPSVVAAIDAIGASRAAPPAARNAAAAAAEAAHAAASAWHALGPREAEQYKPLEELKTAEARKFLGAIEHVTADLAALAAFTAAVEAFTSVGYHNEDFVNAALQRLRPAAPPEARPLPGAGRADRPVAGRAARPPLSREPSVDRPEWTHEGLVDDPREDRQFPDGRPDRLAPAEGRDGSVHRVGPRSREPWPRWTSALGSPNPPGASWVEEQQACNFSLYSRHAERVRLLLFGEDDLARPVVVHDIDPRRNKTWDLWHCRLGEADLRGARYYAYSVDGPRRRPGPPRVRPGQGPPRPLREGGLLPAVVRPRGGPASGPQRRDGPPGRPAPPPSRRSTGATTGPRATTRTRSSTRCTSAASRGARPAGSRPTARGTYAGVVEKIPYLKALGVTAVELLPVQQFDPQEGNYWGYMPLNFFAPHRSYAADPADAAPTSSGRWSRPCTRRGSRSSSTSSTTTRPRGTRRGRPTASGGSTTRTYYLPSGRPRPPVPRLLRLRQHARLPRVRRPHADPRQPALLGRPRCTSTASGSTWPRSSPATPTARFGGPDDPLLTAIRADPVLRDVRLIAEPWDAAGAYQLGTRVPRPALAAVERPLPRRRPPLRPGRPRHGAGPDARGSTAATTSSPTTRATPAGPYQSINFVTCHDGFTLHDLVAYDRKHNEANGHGNARRHGGELQLELRLGRGRGRARRRPGPAAAAGEELLLPAPAGERHPDDLAPATSSCTRRAATTTRTTRTTRRPGSTGTGCEVHADIFRFFRRMIAFRQAHPTLCRSRFWRDDVRWYGVGPSTDLGDDSHSLAFALRGASEGD